MGIRLRRSFASGVLRVPADVITKTADYTADPADEMILVDATSGNVVVTLTASPGAIRNARRLAPRLTIKRIDDSANTVMISQNASETIDGETSQTLASQYDALTLVTDLTNWHIIGKVA